MAHGTTRIGSNVRHGASALMVSRTTCVRILWDKHMNYCLLEKALFSIRRAPPALSVMVTTVQNVPLAVPHHSGTLTQDHAWLLLETPCDITLDMREHELRKRCRPIFRLFDYIAVIKPMLWFVKGFMHHVGHQENFKYCYFFKAMPGLTDEDWIWKVLLLHATLCFKQKHNRCKII